MRPSTLHACLCLALATSSFGFGCAPEVDPELGTETSAVTTDAPSGIPSLRQAMTEAGARALADDLRDELQTNLRDDRLTIHIPYRFRATREVNREVFHEGPELSGEVYSMRVLIEILRDGEVVGVPCYGRLMERVNPTGWVDSPRLYCTDGADSPSLDPRAHRGMRVHLRNRYGTNSFEYPFVALEQAREAQSKASGTDK